MSSREFEEWQVWYAKFQPFGEWRKDFRAGTVASSIVNTLLKAHFKNPTLSKASDWIVDFSKAGKKVATQSIAQMQAICKAIAGGAAKVPKKGDENARRGKRR